MKMGYTSVSISRNGPAVSYIVKQLRPCRHLFLEKPLAKREKEEREGQKEKKFFGFISMLLPTQRGISTPHRPCANHCSGCFHLKKLTEALNNNLSLIPADQSLAWKSQDKISEGHDGPEHIVRLLR
ncbi:hypothetical protein VULLAG_LOCUS563 [Vulpes lagopus]